MRSKSGFTRIISLIMFVSLHDNTLKIFVLWSRLYHGCLKLFSLCVNSMNHHQFMELREDNEFNNHKFFANVHYLSHGRFTNIYFTANCNSRYSWNRRNTCQCLTVTEKTSQCNSHFSPTSQCTWLSKIKDPGREKAYVWTS